jgi:hypothetical protein
VKATASITPTHNPSDETHWASGLRENLTSRSYGEGLETGRATTQAPRQSLTRQNFFAENAFLGVNHLPSLNLNAIQTMLSLRLLAFHVVDNFRHDLGPAYQKKTPELIHREFVDGVQGRVQLHGNIIEVSIYGFEHEAAAAAILTNLDTKLENAGVDPRISWLGNRRLRFTFH